VLATTLDPDGRRVHLTDERWEHVRSDHPELSRSMREIMTAVREPEVRTPGRKPAEERFFVSWRPPGLWLRVVVHYEGDEGWIRTAFPDSSPPR
jgi:hypothetical protein